MKIGVYPGSFDPFTIGHLDVLKSASQLFDQVYAAVLLNKNKQYSFTVEERMEMLHKAVEQEGFRNVRCGHFTGLLVDYVRSANANFIVRGLRATSDFEYEFQIDAVNSHLDPCIRTIYVMSSPAHSFLSSSNVKEIAYWGGSIAGLVPACNEEKILERLARK